MEPEKNIQAIGPLLDAPSRCRTAEARRGGRSDDEIERYVDDIIHEYRQEERDRRSREHREIL